MGAPRFVHLTVKTSLSLLEGMVPTKKLAKALTSANGGAGFAAVGITELYNLFSVVEANKYIASAGVQPILGVELPVLHATPDPMWGERIPTGMLTLLVKNEAGWKNLARLVSESQLRKLTPGGEPGVSLTRVCELNDGLIALSGAYGRGWAALGAQHQQMEAFLTPLCRAFGDRFYVQLERHYAGLKEGSVPNLPSLQAGETTMEGALRTFAATQDVPLVATNDCRFIKPQDVDAFEVLIGIGDSTTMDDPNRRRFTPNHGLRSEDDMLAAFSDLPSATANTVEIAKRCAFTLPQVSVKQMYMPKWEFGLEELGEAGKDVPVPEILRAQSTKGLEQRLVDYVYPRCADEAAKVAAKERYIKQLEYELSTIIGMGFDGYFLITSDFIKWAKANGIPVGPGRGSGAGSLVAWALEITDLDPMRWELYFERFLNPERVSLPDFDVDFCQDRREDVVAYVRRRYGAERVAHIITFGSLKARACLRDVGRVLALPYNFVGQVASLIPEGANPPPIADVLRDDERLKERYENEEDVKRLVDVALQLEGCYRHASTHAAGVIIADRRIDEVCGLYVDPRSPMPVTQFSMGDAEYAGLVKFDFLGLKTLSVIRAAEDMVHTRHNPAFEIAKVDLSDHPTFDMLKTGATLGVFQIEGGGITELTKKMQADDMESLSAILALYRPGPLGTGMVDDYVNCKLGKAEPKYPHPILVPALEVTYGVPVYQEQIMQMARDMAGYTLGGADMLRRAMGKKKPEEMAKERAKFTKGALELHQIAEDESNRVFDLMAGFAEYGFNKAHTIAYALIAFQTAFLKAHFPPEFMAATMTYERGNHEKLLRDKLELDKLGSGLLPPDVNASGVMFTVEGDPQSVSPKPKVRHALAALKGAGEEAMRVLVAERTAKGRFTSVWDMLARLGPQVMNKRQLEVLAKGGALDSLNTTEHPLWRAWLVTNLDTLVAYAQDAAEAKASGQGSLFGGPSESSSAPDPAPYLASCKPAESWDYMTTLQYEAESVGFYLSSHPMQAFTAELARIGNLRDMITIEDFALNGGGACRVAGLVHGVREVKTKSGNRMGIVTLSDPTGQCEVVFFPEIYASSQGLLESTEPVVINVKVAQDGERLRVSADSARTLGAMLGERPELVITLPSAQLIPQVKGVLDAAQKGPTTVKLVVPSPQGRAIVRLPQRLGISPLMLANLKGLGVVVG